NKRRVAKDEIAILRTKKPESVLEFLLIRSDGLHDSYVDQGEGDIHACRPRPKSKTVEQDDAGLMVDHLVVDLEDSLDVVAFGCAANPIVRLAGGTGGLVNHNTGGGNSAVVATLLD